MWMRLPSALAVLVPMLVAPAVAAQETHTDVGGLTVYSEANYGGVQETLSGDTPTLKAIGGDNRVHSVKIDGRDAWELCEAANYGGRCIILPRSEPDLASRRWNGRVSSARRIYGTGATTAGISLSGVELFSEPEFRGHSTKVTSAERSLSDSAGRVASMRVRAGRWELCEQPGFRGRCILVAGDISDVRSIGIVDHVGSLRLHMNLR